VNALILIVILAATPWPTPAPLPTLPRVPVFSTPALPRPTIHPFATPSFPSTEMDYPTPPPDEGISYTDTISMMQGTLDTLNSAITSFGVGISGLETATGLEEEGSGDWDPGLISGTTAFQMADTVVSHMGTAIGYLKGIGMIGTGMTGSLLGPTILFLLTCLGWVGLVFLVKFLVHLVYSVVNFIGSLVKMIPFA